MDPMRAEHFFKLLNPPLTINSKSLQPSIGFYRIWNPFYSKMKTFSPGRSRYLEAVISSLVFGVRSASQNVLGGGHGCTWSPSQE